MAGASGVALNELTGNFVREKFVTKKRTAGVVVATVKWSICNNSKCILKAFVKKTVEYMHEPACILKAFVKKRSSTCTGLFVYVLRSSGSCSV